MKSLILADIHANLAALEAILDHEGTWDEVLFLGDAVVGGPQPDEVLSVMSGLDGVFLMGNHDRETLYDKLQPREKNLDKLWIQWTREQISEPNRRLLDGYSDPCVVERAGLRLRLIHGDLPAELGRRLWPDSPAEVFEALAERYPEPCILLGHSHVQFRKVHGRTTFLNPGGAGQPRLGQPLACYLLLRDGVFSTQAVPYDAEETCRAMDRVPLDRDYVDAWKACYRNGILADRYKLRDFAPLREMGYR